MRKSIPVAAVVVVVCARQAACSAAESSRLNRTA